MTVSRIHSLYGVELADDVAVVLGGIESVNVKTETEHRAEATSGELYPRHQAIVGQKPTADFASVCLAQCLAQIGLAGLSIATLTNGLKLYAYKHTDGGGRSSGSTHRLYTIKKGLIVPRRLTCDHRGDALLTYDVLMTWDGTNDPFIVTDTSAVPTAPTDAERFTIGGITIGAIAIPQVRSFELDFGINAVTEGADSDIFDTFVSIVDVKPVITLRGVDVEWLKSTNIPLAGKAATQANTTIYLRKRLQTSAGYVANGTAEHIKLNSAGLAWIDDVFKSGKGSTECSLKLAAIYDGTNAPVVINTASAIA